MPTRFLIKQIEIMSMNSISRCSCNLRIAPKSYFWFHWYLNNHRLKQAICQIVRFISFFSLKLHMQFLKYGLTVLPYALYVANSIKNIVPDFLLKFFQSVAWVPLIRNYRSLVHQSQAKAQKLFQQNSNLIRRNFKISTSMDNIYRMLILRIWS